ncbi:Stk1 family PASTA domain-containing Ser/Thr kinase [Anaerosphaera multitolerans]|uniref:non-specific serine/threonine protein kinase n=1 Tax=Anaerosphaera multitolerans TaxID=2487351 RepID=A0A437S732_9FIRM|nr:Stk1 family PASTA domain-containing Ser/Thr kinase [Anaerosphaera multitolerans]RVU54758.1 Stk1 family PASTA domain-containing Ser/Thr kinase [Anaerosphaera multitolerans]
MIGKVLGNRYEILEKIGTGGMGDVYKAHDRKLDRIVAVKVLKPEYTDDSTFIRKFKRESLAAASISHPNIVSIYDVGSEEIDNKKIHYIVMEFIDGKTLKEIIREDGRLNEKRALNYTVQVAEALKTAHSKGIVHRDIKTQNIMVTRDDRVKVTDFGIARVADNATVTATNAIMGSVHYFSPEQARGANVDNRSDLYSLGIVLYEMLTGKLPFDAENPVSVALMQVQNDMPLPSKSYSDISPAADSIVLKLTMKNPDDRYRDVYTLIRDIKNIQLGRTSNTDFARTSYQETMIMDDPRVQSNPNGKNKKVIRREDRPSREIEEKKPKKKKKGSPLPVILGIVSAFLIFFLLLYVAPRVFNRSDEAAEMISVPPIVGETDDVARQKLEAVGLVISIEGNTEDPKYEDREVVSQDPKEGTEVEKGSTIKVTVNVLPDAINMPDLVGKTLDEAKEIMKENGLEISEVVEEHDDEVEEGKIISQDPTAGSSAVKDKKITVVVSKGEKEKEEISIPNFKGWDEEEARSNLEAKGFIVEVKKDYFKNVGIGQVADYDPKGTALEGSVIILYVNNGEPSSGGLEEENTNTEDNNEDSKESDTESRNLTIRVPDDGERHHVLVKRTLSSGNVIDFFNYNKTSKDNPIQVPIKDAYKGEKFEVYIDGILNNTEVID